jgi:hypothetical protein
MISRRSLFAFIEVEVVIVILGVQGAIAICKGVTQGDSF